MRMHRDKYLHGSGGGEGQPFGVLSDLVLGADIGSEGESNTKPTKSTAHNGSISFGDQPTHLEM
jgi:hypothetical protein